MVNSSKYFCLQLHRERGKYLLLNMFTKMEVGPCSLFLFGA